MSHYKIQTVVDNWVRCRKSTVKTLRRCADKLESSHKENADVEHTSAAVSLTGDVVGLFGVLLAPVSGGLSLGLCAVSAGTGVGSYLNKRGANQIDEKVTRQVKAECERTLEEDKKATEEFNNLRENFTFLEEQLEIKKIGDILVAVQETSYTNLTISVGDIQGSDYAVQNKANMNIPVLGVTTQLVNLNAALTSAKEVVRYTQITKEVISGTRTVKQVVSTATSVNTISKAAQSLATAKQTAVISMQASQSVTKSATLFAGVARGTDGVIKTAGAVSSVSMSSKRAVDIINASGQIAASAAQSVTKAAGAGKVITTATKGAKTIKTVKNIKQASSTVKSVTQVAKDADKAIRTTRLTTDATKVTKVTQTATKAASISKLGLAINAVVIPLDLYNLIVASDNLGKSYDDVKSIRAEADKLEKEIENIHEEIKIQVDTFTQLHVQLFKVYKDHHIKIIYEYLLQMHEKLEFRLPPRF